MLDCENTVKAQSSTLRDLKGTVWRTSSSGV